MAMQPATTHLTTIGSIATLAADYAAIKAGQYVDIRTECLCWASLALGLWVQPYIRRENSKNYEEGLPSSLNRMVWAVSICIAVARIIPVYFDVSAALPLATIAAFLYSYRTPLSNGELPGPGPKAAPILSTMKGPGKGRMQLFQAVIFIMLGIWCCFIFKPEFSSGANSFYFPVFFVFALMRMAAFVLLDATCKNHDLSSLDNRDALFKTASAIVFRVFVMVTGVMVVFPPQIGLALPAILHTGCTMAGLVADFFLILLGGMVSATTIDAYSVATIRSLITKASLPALSFSIASILSLTQAAYSLPSSSVAARRRVFLALAVVPILTLYVSRATSFRSEFQLPPSVHPIQYLTAENDAKFHQMLSRQSQTLEEACAEYQRRYKRKPPANFDKWFSTAKNSGFQLIDEFDTMMTALEPLWGVSPADIRGRVEYALNAGHMSMIRFAITDHQLSFSMENFAAWMAGEIYGWFDQEVLDTLPDMVFAVNTRDEPKVVVPHDIFANTLNNVQPPNPGIDHDMSQRVEFMEVGKQNAWDAMSISCPADSPARGFGHHESPSPVTLSDFGFLSNITMSKDICQFPGLRDLHAMLLSPESLSMTHSLVPVFSQAKISTFQDLLYPSPWYAAKYDMLEYQEDEDRDWDEKENVVYWTGTNTGGHSTMENWRSFQRQRLTLMATDQNRPISLLKRGLQSHGGSNAPRQAQNWQPVNSTIQEISHAFRMRISAVIQCEQDACDDQQFVLGVGPELKDDINASYETRYNLDVDGNGFSGRFYRLLRSRSAVLKQTLYKEWHDDWLIPWVHYIPVNMDLDDLPEIIRYLTQEPEGQALGKKVAEASREWAGRVLRKQDMVLVFWRLLLEYGRILNDDREMMNCCS